MNPDPNNPYAYMDTLHSQQAKRGSFKAIGIILLVLLFLSMAGAAGYLWMQNSDLQGKLAAEQANSKTLASQNANLEGQLKDTPTMTVKLPNGQSATFPDTAGNRRILFWSAGIVSTTDDVVLLSNSAIQTFLSGVDPTIITKYCGTTAVPTTNLYNISIGLLNTATKEVTKPQNGSCLDVLASSVNTDPILRKNAQEVYAQVQSDLTDFTDAVEIK